MSSVFHTGLMLDTGLLPFRFNGTLHPKQVAVRTVNRMIPPDEGAATDMDLV